MLPGTVESSSIGGPSNSGKQAPLLSCACAIIYLLDLIIINCLLTVCSVCWEPGKMPAAQDAASPLPTLRGRSTLNHMP